MSCEYHLLGETHEESADIDPADGEVVAVSTVAVIVHTEELL